MKNTFTISADCFNDSSKGKKYSTSIVLISMKIFEELNIVSFEYDKKNRVFTIEKGIRFDKKNDLSASQTFKLYNGKE